MTYLYSEADIYHFMDSQTYEQIALNNEALGDTVNYLTPEATITIEFFEGQPIGIELPTWVELSVVDTPPELKGATASNSNKPATLETGLTIQVPPFIQPGDKIRVDTRDGVYLDRAK